MAPRTRKAAPAPAPAPAGEEDGCPALKLIMEKGPLSGQTNEFRPEARIQIGRVVRGNTICIKDAGISTNHLLIQVNPDAAGRRLWTATDLGSSNGTFLNDELLDPSEPAALSEGDVIKIGGKTSIKVAFGVTSGGEVEVEVNPSNVRRNARRGVRKQVEELVVIDEDSELGLGDTDLGHLGINEKNAELGNEGGDLGAIGEIKPRGRRTRGSKAREVENGSTEEMESTGKLSLRRTRSAKNNDIQSKVLNLDGDKDLEPIGVKGIGRVSVRRTRSSRKEENTDGPLVDLSVIECKWTRKGTRGSTKVDVETPLGEKKEESELKVCEEEKRISEVGADERETLERETATEFASTSGVKEVGVEAGKEMDLEKMTLGEWFDNLEVYLPKQIIESTEVMISEMRRKAERLHEFVLQQKDSEGKGNVAME